MKKKLLPVLTVLCLIILVIGVGMVTLLIKRYAPSKEKMDGAEYFQVTGEDEAALIVNRTVTGEKVKIIDGRYYVENAVVGKYINGRFYWDGKQNVMLYTLPTEEFQITPDTQEYQTSQGVQSVDYVILKSQGDTCYLDLEFVAAYTDMTYMVYENPNRVAIQTRWGDTRMVEVNEKSVIRQKGGIKSTILTEVQAGDLLYLEEELENWSKVATDDGYTGYIQKKDISQPETITLTHTSTAPEYTNIRKDYKINLGWHQVTSQEGNAALASIVANTQGLNTISPTWFSVVDNAGTISSLASADYVNQAHGMGLEVWGLIDNFNTNADTLTFLSDTQVRANIINQLMAQADAVGLDGINLDFESITEEQAPHYVQFIRELSIACRNRGLVFSIDNPVPMPYNRFYNRKEQGIVADYVIIMGYDEHYSGSDAGSVASLPWVEQGIQDTLEEVPADRVINAVPFYTRLWKTTGGAVTSEAIGMDQAQQVISEKNVETYWDKNTSQNYGTYEEDNSTYQIWLEDAESIAAKVKLASKYKLAGVAAWKLGFENSGIWQVITDNLQ